MDSTQPALDRDRRFGPTPVSPSRCWTPASRLRPPEKSAEQRVARQVTRLQMNLRDGLQRAAPLAGHRDERIDERRQQADDGQINPAEGPRCPDKLLVSNHGGSRSKRIAIRDIFWRQAAACWSRGACSRPSAFVEPRKPPPPRRGKIPQLERIGAD